MRESIFLNRKILKKILNKHFVQDEKNHSGMECRFLWWNSYQWYLYKITSLMGNNSSEEKSKNDLPFFSRSDSDYNPLAED